MKTTSTIFLQIVIVLIGIGVLTFMLWEPHFEGRNVDATAFEVYFKDPFLAYAYLSSIAFFSALYKAFKIFGYVRDNKTFSQVTVNALRTIKYCASILVGFVVGAEIWLFIFQRGKDDIAGGVFMGLLMIAVSGVVASVAGVLERIVEKVVEIKSDINLAI